MRLLVENFGDVRVFKDRALLGLPRYVIEFFDPDFGFRHTKVFSAVWYNRKTVLEIAKEMQNEF